MNSLAGRIAAAQLFTALEDLCDDGSDERAADVIIDESALSPDDGQ